MAEPSRDWRTAEEAATRCGVWPATIRERIQRGELTAERVGRHWRIPQQAVEALRKEMRRKPRPSMPTAEETEARRREVRDLHEQEMSVPAIAATLGVNRSTVYKDQKSLGLEPRGHRRPRSKLTREQLEQLPTLYEGSTLAEIAAMWDVSTGYVRNELERLGIRRRPSGTRPKWPEPTERRCAQCEKPFTPTSRAAWARRFCAEACAQKASSDAYETALADTGLLSAAITAERLTVSTGSVYSYISAGLLGAEELTPAGRSGPRLFGIREAELARFEREWVRGAARDGRRQRWIDPDQAVKQLDRMGLLQRRAIKTGYSLADIERLERSRRSERAARLRRHNRGRKPGAPPPHFHFEWRDRYAELKAEMVEASEQDRDLLHQRLKDTQPEELRAALASCQKPTHREICEELAEEDWREHPERWSRTGYPPSKEDPAMLRPDMRPDAGKRVAKALKRLQSLGTGNTRA